MTERRRRLKGTVLRINERKGFCFIEGVDGVERFGHESSLLNADGIEALRIGDEVEFEHMDAPKGPRATSIRIVRLLQQSASRDPLADVFPNL